MNGLSIITILCTILQISRINNNFAINRFQCEHSIRGFEYLRNIITSHLIVGMKFIGMASFRFLRVLFGFKVFVVGSFMCTFGDFVCVVQCKYWTFRKFFFF